MIETPKDALRFTWHIVYGIEKYLEAGDIIKAKELCKEFRIAIKKDLKEDIIK